MSWSVVWTDRARRDLRGLDRQGAARVVAVVDRYGRTEHGDVKRLQDVRPPAWRLRVGDVRVLLSFDHGTRAMQIERVLPRGRAYRD